MIPSHFRKALLTCAALLPLVTAAGTQAATHSSRGASPTTPIQHVIIIVGENRTYDHLFATYVPPKGFTFNLLSEHIISADGSPDSNFVLGAQHQASDTTVYEIDPHATSKYKFLPAPTTTYVSQTGSDTSPPPYATIDAAEDYDFGVEIGDIPLLTTGATGLPPYSVDTRIPNVNTLPDGPFPLTGMYDDYAASPVHRFFQSWQQLDCSVKSATVSNPSGCRNDLFPWVDITAGFSGDNATNMGIYNVQSGDAAYFVSLANSYAMADNYHQPIAGGTGANSIVLGYADALWYSDGNGHPLTPPQSQIENPNPKSGTNNQYTNDGYSAGSYVNCADVNQPGVKAVRSYLAKLPYKPHANCAPGTYYLVNNYNPGYNEDGTLNTSTFTIPPSSVASIADDMEANGVSWAYYGEDWNRAVAHQPNAYCNICNPFQYETHVMANKTERTTHLKDLQDLSTAIGSGNLPAVSYVKPSGLNDGHPASSKFDIFEAFTKKILDQLKANPKLFANTAVFITTDEGGGYYDSGYVQPVDFFGDASRIPLIVVSPFSKGVGVVHSYNDHASIVKFIEANWALPPITSRSRDNLPNPVQDQANPYVPTNGPAIGDLMDFFKFK